MHSWRCYDPNGTASEKVAQVMSPTNEEIAELRVGYFRAGRICDLEEGQTSGSNAMDMGTFAVCTSENALSNFTKRQTKTVRKVAMAKTRGRTQQLTCPHLPVNTTSMRQLRWKYDDSHRTGDAQSENETGVNLFIESNVRANIYASVVRPA